MLWSNICLQTVIRIILRLCTRVNVPSYIPSVKRRETSLKNSLIYLIYIINIIIKICH